MLPKDILELILSYKYSFEMYEKKNDNMSRWEIISSAATDIGC